MIEIFFEDLKAGEVVELGRHEVGRDEILAFAREFDPQPFHVDEEAARSSFAGGLIASGWHTAGLQMRMLCDGWLLRAASLGAPGIDELKWLRPVRAGDVLAARQTITEIRASKSRPDRGLAQFLLQTVNQDGETVLEQRHWGMIARRGASPAPHGVGPGQRREGEAETDGQDAVRAAAATAPRDFEAVEIGQVTPLGRHLFTEADILRFGRSFDPQPFHVDPEAALRSSFGGLAASGWHTASAWMRHLVDVRRASAEAARADGGVPPLFGVSPGFRDMRFLRPVYAGDVIAFETEVVDKRASASRPGWGLVFSRNTGRDAAGEVVFEFSGSGFMAFRDVAQRAASPT